MMPKKIIVGAMIVFVMLVSIGHGAALTASIGNSRAVVHASPGDTLNRMILIKNVNDVDVRIVLTSSGDLADGVTFSENNFTLKAKTDKEVKYAVKVAKGGTTETKLNVAFVPPEGNGVGISATLIVVAGEDNEDIEDEPTTPENNAGLFPWENNDVPDDEQETGKKFSLSPLAILSLSTGLLIAIFIVLLIYATKFRSKKRAGRSRA